MKYLFFIAALSISALCSAQKQTIVFVKANGQKTNDRDSALLIRTVTDPNPGSNLYGFTETFVSGEPFRSGKTVKADAIVPDGECTVFYPSGKKLSEIVFHNGLADVETAYFPNGVIFAVKQITYSTPDPAKPARYEGILINTCNDSTGKALITDGNGYFMGYTPTIDKKFVANVTSSIYYSVFGDAYDEGNIKNGKRDDVWKNRYATGMLQYTETYKDGKLISGESVDKEGKHYQYTSLEKSAEFPGGIQAFYKYLGLTIRYPADARVNNIQGRVYATFVVQKDGSLTDIKILKSPSNDLSDETVRVLKLSPLWTPGQQRGIAVRQQYTVPVNYALSTKSSHGF